MLLLIALYPFCLGLLFTVFLVLLGDELLSTIVLADLMLLVGPQLGPLPDSMFLISLSDQPLSLASEVLNGQSNMDAESAAQVLSSIFPNARIPSVRDSILLAFALPPSQYVLFAMLPLLCGLLMHYLNRLFFPKLFGNRERPAKVKWRDQMKIFSRTWPSFGIDPSGTGRLTGSHRK